MPFWQLKKKPSSSKPSRIAQLESDLALQRQLQKSQSRVESDANRLMSDIESKQKQIRFLEDEIPSLQSQLQKASLGTHKERRTLSKIDTLTRRAAAEATLQVIAEAMQKKYDLGWKESQCKNFHCNGGDSKSR